MRWFESLRALAGQTAANLWRHKLRSFLTMFGIAWGVASLALMGALADGFRVGQRKNWEQIGNNLVALFPGKTSRQAGGQRAGRPVRLYEENLDAIRRQCPAVAVVAGEMKRYGTPVASDFNSGRYLAVGVGPEYLKLRNLPAGTGRQIAAADVEEARRVCVLGHSVRKQLFGDRGDILGQWVRINSYPYQVIGAMAEKDQNSSYDGWDNDKILVPAPCLKRDAPPSAEAHERGRLGAILYQPVSVKRWEEARGQVRRVLGRIHEFDPEDPTALFVADYVELAELFDSVYDSTEIFLAAVALVTLSLGGLGVMNTMLTAVTERTNEIGLKKALGATSRRILLDFFLEGVALASVSGTAGLCFLAVLTTAVNSLPMPAFFAGLPVDTRTALTAILALGAVTIVSAAPPAWRASRLTPVEALRFER
ncbi:MAG: ABC transporter permease [Acidobacteria bacterium]|nr:ABC transporter permease [Acidobacteriota bacterium]